MQDEKKAMQKQASQIKLEITKKKQAESSVKRENALKHQRETIERKIVLQNVKAEEKKKEKEYELEI